MSIMTSASADHAAIPIQKNREAKKPVEGQLLYPVPQAARIIGISPRLLWEFIAAGEVKSRKIRGRRLVHRRELEKFANRDHEGAAR